MLLNIKAVVLNQVKKAVEGSVLLKKERTGERIGSGSCLYILAPFFP
jgi:hypothetical protein